MKFEWELIYIHETARTFRVKVFGGWIVNNEEIYKEMFTESMVFVPDKNHEWAIEK